MAAADIVIKGAREHNLRDVNLTLPRNRLICLTGVSGSGKSSLAFDTLYAEGQRRYVESLSSFARQFLGQMSKPDVDYIGGLSPSISISQKSSGQNPRSTVGTITEIYDYLRVLYARTGTGHCPQCQRPITAQTREQIIDRIESLPAETRFSVLAPLVKAQKGEYRDLFEDLTKQGFARARVDGTVVPLSSELNLDRQMRHNIEVVIDRLTASSGRARLAEAVDLALRMGSGNLIIAPETGEASAAEARKLAAALLEEEGADEDRAGEAVAEKPASAAKGRSRSNKTPGDLQLSAHYACTHCGLSFEPPSPQLFSFNSPQGMCSTCNGLGQQYTFDPEKLVTNPKLSFKQGCIELVGGWRDLGRWRRHIYAGVAETIERKQELPAGTMLETPWQDLPPELQTMWLWGAGDLHVTFTWRQGGHAQKYGGHFEGVIPQLLSRHRNSQSKMQLRQLEKFMCVLGCPTCAGARLNPQAQAVTLRSRHPDFAERPALSLPNVSSLAISDAAKFFEDLDLSGARARVAEEILKEIRGRLGFLINVGLEYLTLNRTAPTLSGGESQRIRLAGQIGCGLVGVLYILDEPSIGLHPRDNDRLLDTLTTLRDMGNTVVVVEHDEDTMRAADHLVDFGPGPGVRGGEVVAFGSVADLSAAPRSQTGKYLSGEERIERPSALRPLTGKTLRIVGARHNNLKGVDVDIPLGAVVCVTGVSGSGKSSLVNDILADSLHRDLNGGESQPGLHDRIEGVEHLDKLIAIDQSPIGRTPRSNPSTYIKLFDEIRDLYTQLPESKARGYKAGRFSFNVNGGRCEACEGNGSNKLDMDFLADIWVTCPVCEGRRFNRETLQVKFKGKSISEVLEMDVQDALKHFENVPKIRHKLQTLHDVGLDYLKLGQPSPTLSGGEAQRVKLARELVKKSTGRTLYLLDEPTTGLHFADIKLLLKVLHSFADAGNTVLVVEHNLDVIKTADWVIDMGPEGGSGGGRLIVEGPPAQIALCEASHTGRALRAIFEPNLATKNGSTNHIRPPKPQAKSIRVQGARQHNLKDVSVEIPRDEITVCCGMSGSGKSSLAMDTIYAEGQRRYVESLSSYARQFVGQMQKPALDHIEGLSPAIAIEQKHLGHTPRSTVGTVTEIYDYLRILFARLGESFCPDCDLPIGTQTADEIIDKLLEEPAGTKLYLMAPLEVAVGDRYEALWEEIRASGYVRVRIDGTTHAIDQVPTIDRRRKHTVEVVLDRLVARPDARARLADTVENALALGKGVLHVAYPVDDVPESKWRVEIHSQHFACDQCGRSFERLTPHSFSFNSQLGWCTSCEGLGTQTGVDPGALLRDPKLTLAEGAIALWPAASNALFERMLAALSAHTGVPTTTPFEQLSSRQRRVLFYGTGEDWIAAYPAGPQSKTDRPLFRFQFKGLYPAIEEACRLSPGLRARWDSHVGEVECSTCGGSRLRDDAAATKLRERTIDSICRMPLGQLLSWFSEWKLDRRQQKIAGELAREVRNRLQFLVDVGLEYLTLGRAAPTLSGGEAQRIRLASQVGSGLCGVLYVLDEPTIGLHPRDNRRLIGALEKLRDLGNTLLVVEHDREVIAGADQVLDFGPAAGDGGGQIVARGTPSEIMRQKGSVTGPFLSGVKAIAVPTNRRMKSTLSVGASTGGESDPAATAAARKRRITAKNKKQSPAAEDGAPPPLRAPGGWLEIIGARHHNLRNVSTRIPLGCFTVVCGVSGSGKSSLIEDVLYNALARTLHRASTTPGAHDAIRGLEFINKVIRVDQQPLGNTPTSNPATYTGVFDLIRNLFAQLPDSRLRGFTARRFSFNVPGGRCEACEGNGQLKIEMHFLPDVWVECDTCHGKRYNPETLAVTYHGQSIADVLEMSCGKAAKLFENIPQIRRILQTLCDVGLEYVRLGQPAPTLSGGEAQRVKLAAELARPDTGRTLYLLDEPTTGLHFEDVAKLLDVLNRLVDLGNSVVVIEHNLDVVKTADWIIEMGPEAGYQGGHVVAAGTPEDVVARAGAWIASSGGATTAAAKTTRSRATKRPSKQAADVSASTDKNSQPLWRCHTGEALREILEAGPHQPRGVYDFSASQQSREGDVDIAEVGRDAHMPWEANGRRWHTVDRVSRQGTACRWDGRILAEVVDRIQSLGSFSETNWNHRSIVEIASTKKSDGWFLHAGTGEEWLLKLKFHTAKSTFNRDTLIAELALKPLNDLPDLPVYGHEPRVKVKNLPGPWQEIQLQVSTYAEIDRPEFWKFLERAITGFQKVGERMRQNPDDVMPWKVLGQKWHFARKGFPPGRPPQWDVETLEELCEILQTIAPHGQMLWNNQQVVHMFVGEQREPWASLWTKRSASLELTLSGPQGHFALGRIAELGLEREFTPSKTLDVVKLRFRTSEDLERGELREFIREHLASLATGKRQAVG